MPMTREALEAEIVDAIRAGDDDLYAAADALGMEVFDTSDALTAMADKGLLYRWSDNDVTRYGVRRERRAA